MKFSWQKCCCKLTANLALEIALNLLGLDNLANYSEFLFSDKNISLKTHLAQTMRE